MTSLIKEKKTRLGKNEKLLLRFINNHFGVSTPQLKRKSGLYIEAVRASLRRLRKRGLIFSIPNSESLDSHPQILIWYRNG